MKKMKCISLLLCMSLLLQALAITGTAAETTGAPVETAGAATLPSEQASAQTQSTQAAEDLPFGTACVQNGCRTIEGMVPLAGSDRKLESAQAAFLYEVNTGTVVYSYNPDVKISPGSLTKLVTGMVVLQHCEMDEIVTITGDVHRRPAGSIHAGLKTDEEISVKDLIHCLLLESANDAAIALAVHVAGNQSSFITLMNQWVTSIGCTNTQFESVHGLDDNSMTSARDMARIMMAANENETMVEILGTLSYTVGATNKNEERSFRTGNYMIDKGNIEDFQDSRVTGGMFSYVQAYGASLVVSMETDPEEDPPGEMQFIGVVLGCTRTFDPNLEWKAIVYGNFNEMTDLMKLGFNNFKVNRIIYDGMTLSQFAVAGGECNAVGQARVDIDSVVPISANMNNLYMTFNITDGGLTAPVKKDDLIATMQIKYLNSVLAEAEVYAMGSVSVAGDNGVTIHGTEVQTRGDGSGVLSVIGTICVIVLGLVAAYLAFNSYMRSRMRARRRKRRADRRRNY